MSCSGRRAGVCAPLRPKPECSHYIHPLSPKTDLPHLRVFRPLLMERPDIVVGTPGRVLAHLNARNLDLKAALELLVIDEADQIFHHGYEDDIKTVLT